MRVRAVIASTTGSTLENTEVSCRPFIWRVAGSPAVVTVDCGNEMEGIGLNAVRNSEGTSRNTCKYTTRVVGSWVYGPVGGGKGVVGLTTTHSS